MTTHFFKIFNFISFIKEYTNHFDSWLNQFNVLNIQLIMIIIYLCTFYWILNTFKWILIPLFFSYLGPLKLKSHVLKWRCTRKETLNWNVKSPPPTTIGYVTDLVACLWYHRSFHRPRHGSLAPCHTTSWRSGTHSADISEIQPDTPNLFITT